MYCYFFCSGIQKNVTRPVPLSFRLTMPVLLLPSFWTAEAACVSTRAACDASLQELSVYVKGPAQPAWQAAALGPLERRLRW